MAGGEYRKRDGRDHKHDSCPSGGFREYGCGRASTEGGLAPHASEGGGNVSTLPALQQHHNDQEQTNDDVNDGNQDNHVVLNPRVRRSRKSTRNCAGIGNIVTLYVAYNLGEAWCGRGDLNPHAFRRHPLKMVCLPISPLPHTRPDAASITGSKQKRRGN